MNILMLSPKYPAETFWNLDSVVRAVSHRSGTMPPLGLLTIASYLPDDFHLRLVDRNVGEESAADWEWADVAMISLMPVQQEDYRVCLGNALFHRVPIALGGPYTSNMPEKAIAEADWICFGEAEPIMDELVADLRADRRGKQYRSFCPAEMEKSRQPRYDLLSDINDYIVMPVQFSRGCPFDCEFCDVVAIYGRTPRTKSSEQTIKELDAIARLGFEGSIFLVDDNLIGDRKKALVVLEALADWNARHGMAYTFLTQSSLNLADDERLLCAMARANFLFVFIGIESSDPVLLRAAGKFQNLSADVIERLRVIRANGIHVIAGLIVGFDGEDKGVFDRQMELIEAGSIGVAQQFLLQALPNSRLFERLQREDRILPGQEMSGNCTLEGINFVPRGGLTRRQYLAGYARMLGQLYEPEAFFRRTVPAYLQLRHAAKVPVKPGQLMNLVRLCWIISWHNARIRRHFWHAFLKVVRRNPRSLAAFYYDCLHYMHLNQHVSRIEQTISTYLEDPDADDVLDVVVPVRGSAQGEGTVPETQACCYSGARLNAG